MSHCHDLHKTKDYNIDSTTDTMIGKSHLDSSDNIAGHLGQTHTDHLEIVEVEHQSHTAMSHTMDGIPVSLQYISISAIIIISFLIIGLSKKKAKELYQTYSITKWQWLNRLTKKRYFQFIFQLPFAGLFLLIIIAGLFGNQLPNRNIAPLLTWTIWWGSLILMILFFAKLWCFLCPWDGLTSWIARLSFFKVKLSSFSLGLKWPSWLKNIYPATFLFILLTWLELGFNVTLSPAATAYFALAMFGMALLPYVIFEKKSFCRYGCLVGRISGLYAMFAPLEIRSINKSVCQSCQTLDCYNGNDKGYPCPTGQNLRTMSKNTYCTFCTECFKSCPNDNVTLNLRAFNTDLANIKRERNDEAILILFLLSITIFHGLTMTKVWDGILAFIDQFTYGHYLLSFSLGMIGMMAIPFIMYALIIYLTRLFVPQKEVSYRSLFIGFSYSLIPVALFYHIAHNIEHLLMESAGIIPLLSDPFGYGWNLFGTAQMKITPLFSMELIWVFQVLMILIGHIYGLSIGHRLAGRYLQKKRALIISQVPVLVLMVIASLISIWLIAQPMIMRGMM